MNIRRIIREELDDLQWIKDIEPVGVDLMLNKAFYFDPNREDFNNNLYADYYNRLTTRLVHLGFVSIYNTPLEADPNYFNIEGLYVYRNQEDGDLVFVFTSADRETETEEDYKQHIISFAYDESEDRGKNLEVVDAINFVNTYL